MRALLASVLVVGLSAGTSRAADETYTIKLYKSKEGTKNTHERSESSKASTVLETDGLKKEENTASGLKETYTEEILEIDAATKQVTKLQRTYTVAEKTEKGETTKTVYAGKTVLIEKKGNEYVLSIDGKPLTEDEAPDLVKTYSEKKADEPTNEDLMPAEAVKVGQSWKIAGAKSEKLFQALGDGKAKYDADKSTIEGKLLKVYKRAGAQFGVMELTVTMVVTEIGTGEELVRTTADSKMVMKITIDTCIDGTVEFEDSTADIDLDIAAEIPDAGSIAVRGTMTLKSKIGALKK